VEGTVVRAVNGFFYVQEHDRLRQCRARGVFRKRGITVLVGDQVVYDSVGDEGVIVEVKPRRTELYRPPIANIDQALLVFSVRTPDFLPNLLDRMLVAVVHAGIAPVIVLSKVDLVDALLVHDLVAPYLAAGYFICTVSKETGAGYGEVISRLQGHVTVLAGPSGAGKSTLANQITPELALKMGEVSDKLGRGRHTTRHVELYALGDDTYVADAPGFSQLDLHIASTDVRRYFPEIAEVGRNCDYRRCLHIDESPCAVKSAIGEYIFPSRYDSYRAIVEELRDREAHMY
jgi:ribosome biogenesis GTPase / thiamine phosphate phosphatase